MSENKWKCEECAWTGYLRETLRARNPFDLANEEVFIRGCPICHEINHFEELCDVEGCGEPATCGFRAIPEYRRTCGKHYIEAQQKDQSHEK